MYKFYTTFPVNPQPHDVIVREQGYMKYVAVIGYDNDWACYEAPVNWQHERAANDGDKISENHALELFPEFNRLSLYYRW